MQKKGILEWQNPEMKEAVDAIENGFFFLSKAVCTNKAILATVLVSELHQGISL